MVTLALCEDNEFQREMMQELLEDYSGRNNTVSVEIFGSGRELLDHVKQNGGFDIYILDVVMPDMNGMEVASTLRLMKDEGKIIFTTASLEYAVASYDVKAYYYMVKPVDPNKLFRILDGAVAELKPKENTTVIRMKNGDVSLRLRDIMYVEVVDRALVVHLADGRTCKSLALRGSFRESVPDLAGDARFAACGASKLVNLKYIDAIDSETVLLKDGTIIYPPRSAYADLRRQWREFTR